MITLGILIAACCNAVIMTYTSGEFEWRMALAVQIIPGVLLLILTIFMPYSPRWLADRDRDSETIHTLARLRGSTITDDAIQQEYRDIKSNVEYEREIGTASWKELLKPGIINRVLIGVTLQFFQQWTGINVILYYQQKLLEDMGFSKEVVAIPLTIANDFINFMGTFPGMYLVEKMGRRSLLVIGGFGMGISLFLVCMFTAMAQAGTINGYFGVVSVYAFILFFASTWGPVVWVYQSEIFPMRVRAKASGLATVSNWSWNAVIAKVTPLIILKIGVYNYLIFGTMCMLMGGFTFIFVPETKGKSLEDMDDVFGSSEDISNLESAHEGLKHRKVTHTIVGH
jgi:SP family sugar:H+ symporter-like MFS transporter